MAIYGPSMAIYGHLNGRQIKKNGHLNGWNIALPYMAIYGYSTLRGRPLPLRGWYNSVFKKVTQVL